MQASFFKNFYFFSFLMLYFPMLTIYFCPGSGNGNLSFGLVLSIILYVTILLKPVFFIKFIINCYNYIHPFRIYLAFLIYILILMCINILMGKYTAPLYFYAIRITRFLLASTLVFFLPLLASFLNISIKNVYKLLIIAFWSMMLIGVIQYISLILHIKFLLLIINLLTYARGTLYFNPDGIAHALRVNALFNEPSSLGQFIFIMLPIIYHFSKLKTTLFKNVFFNKLVKKTIIPLALLVTIFTKSPIYLVLVLLEYFVLLITNNQYLSKKYLIVILSFILFGITLILTYFLSNYESITTSFLGRIINTLNSFGDFSILVTLEPSLATRIVAYSAQLVAFTKHIIFGCGLYNVEAFANTFFLQETPLPLTYENYQFGYLIVPYIVNMNKSLVYTGLAEFGIFGMSLYSIYIFQSVQALNQIIKRIKRSNEILYRLSKGVKQSIFAIILLSFYNLYFESVYMCLIIGTSSAIIYKYHQLRKGKIC